MSLLDGPDQLLLYPEAPGPDRDGNPARLIDWDADGVPLAGSMQPQASSPDDPDQTRGQGVVTSYRLLARRFPAGAWAGARWNGRRFRVVGEPRRRVESQAMAHATVTLVAIDPQPVPVIEPALPVRPEV